MSTSVVKTSKVVKGLTSNIRTQFDVFDRARDIYLNQIKKAEADYYERIKRGMAILTEEVPENVDTPLSQTAAE